MTEDQLRDLRYKLQGCTLTVEDDPDNEGFFSVYADKDRSGAEIAGKIGERCVAVAIASTLAQLLR